jgi:hypothetical protein
MEGNSEVESRLRKILVIKSLRDRASPRALRIIQYYSEFPCLPISVTFLEITITSGIQSLRSSPIAFAHFDYSQIFFFPWLTVHV